VERARDVLDGRGARAFGWEGAEVLLSFFCLQKKKKKRLRREKKKTPKKSVCVEKRKEKNKLINQIKRALTWSP
jgi:hypothetical protein